VDVVIVRAGKHLPHQGWGLCEMECYPHMSDARQSRHVAFASRGTLLQILETLPGPLFVVDDAATIVYMNTYAQSMLETTSEEVYGTSLWRCAPQLVGLVLYQAIQQVQQSRELTDVAYVSSVTQRWLHASLSPTDEGLAIFFQEQLEPPFLQHTFSQNEQRYQRLLESCAHRITILSPNGLVLESNQYSQTDATDNWWEEVVGTSFLDCPVWSADPAIQQRLRTAIAQACRGETVHFEARIHPQADRYLDVLMTITPQQDAKQQIEYLICASQDITVCRQSDNELRTIVDAIPHLVWMMRPDGTTEYINQRWCDYTGITPKQIQGDTWLQAIHPEDRLHAQQAWETSVRTGIPYEVEHRIQQSNGVYRWFSVRGIPYQDTQGTILYWIGTCTDIEEQKRAELRLKASEENMRVLAEMVPQLGWTAQPDGQLDYCNQRCYEYTQATFEQIRNDAWIQFVHPDDVEQILALRRHAFSTGEPYEVEYRLRDGHTGTYRWFLVRALPMHDDSGQIVKWIGTSTDIHDKKRTETELRVLVDAIPHLVWILYPDGSAEYANQRWCDYTGIGTQQYLKSSRHLVVHPDDYQRSLTLRQHAFATGEPYEVEYRLRDGHTGTYRWFLVRALPVCDYETGQIIKWIGTSTDIEEQKKTEEALRQSQAQASALMNSTVIGININDGEQIVDANDTFLRMTGYTSEDLHAGKINWMDMTPPEYLARTLQAHQELDASQSMTPYEKEYVCKDGSRLPVVVGRVAFQSNPSQGIAFVLDNSARKELEQRKDNFISMASHELRNPLAALKLQIQLTRKRLERQSQHETSAALSRVERPIQQLERLIADLLDVSKIQAGKLEYLQETVDLNTLLRDIVATMHHVYPSHDLVVHGALQTSLPGDQDRLGQVFTNLISNAIKYSPNARSVEIDLSASATTVTIRVQDHGPGIAHEQRDKIFERFYRATDSKRKGIPGLGMGLYIVAEIVKHYGGTISVDGDVGKGSIFTVTLPLKENA